MESTVRGEMPGEPRIDRDRCMGSGQCLWYAPNTFGQDEDNLAVVIDPSGDPEESVRNAIDGCPAQAISLTGADNGTE